MPEEAVAIALDQMEQADYVKAREEGRTTLEVKPEEPAKEEQKEAETPEVAKEQEEKHKGGGLNKRFDRLTKLAKEAEERAERLERELQEMRRGGEKKEPPKPKEGEPTQEDYTDYEEYLIDKAAYRLEQKQLAAKAEAQRNEEDARLKKNFDSYNEQVIAARAKYEDYDSIKNINTPWVEGTPADVKASQAFQLAILEESNGAEIIYFLGKNPEELAKFADLSPIQVTKLVGKIGEKLQAEPAQDEEQDEQPEEKEEKPKKVPTVIKPVNTGSARSSVTLDNVDSQKEYVKMRQAGRKR